MSALPVLLGCALGLLALGAVARVAPRHTPLPAAVLCLAGLLAAIAALLSAPVATLSLGLSFGLDGLSAIMLACLFLLGAAGTANPVTLGTLALAILSADGIGLILATAAALLPLPALGEGRGEGPNRTRNAGSKALPLATLAALFAAMALLGGLDPRFAGMRAIPPDGLRAALILATAAAGAAIMPQVLPAGLGGLFGIYVLARVLLDLAGPVTPVWWGVPILVLGAAWAVLGARRAAEAEDLGQAGADAALAAQGLAALGLGAALLARGADLLPLAALAVSGALLQILAWSMWGALLATIATVIRAGAGGTSLVRLGGLLRRAPLTGLALLVALSAMAALPFSAGFAGLWPVIQALAGAGRLGGVALLMIVAGALAALGLATALLAAAAVRLGGVVLLGAPRSARAAAIAEPSRRIRAGMAALAAAALLLGICPALGLFLARPAARLLAGGVPDGAGWLGVALLADGPGYAAAPLALLFVALAAGFGLAARGTPVVVPPWQGGFAEDGVGRGNTWPLSLPLPSRRVDPVRAVLALLALALAAAIGWAAR